MLQAFFSIKFVLSSWPLSLMISNDGYSFLVLRMLPITAEKLYLH